MVPPPPPPPHLPPHSDAKCPIGIIFALEKEEDSLRKKRDFANLSFGGGFLFSDSFFYDLALQYVAGGSEEERNSVSRAVNLFIFLLFFHARKRLDDFSQSFCLKPRIQNTRLFVPP